MSESSGVVVRSEEVVFLKEARLQWCSILRPYARQKPSHVYHSISTGDSGFTTERIVVIMADKLNCGLRYWAVLIGINFYEKNPLKGCVRDVERVKHYLETGSTLVLIEAFIATAGSSTSRRPTEK